MLKEAKECDAMIGKERWRRDEVKKQTGESKTVREHLEANTTEGQTSDHGEIGLSNEVTKNVCFNSQPQFAPSQEVTHFEGDEEMWPGRCVDAELKTNPLQPRGILKSPKASTSVTTYSPVKAAAPIELTDSQSSLTSPAPQLLGLAASMPTSPTEKSTSTEPEEVTPPNSPSVLASVRKSSQAKPNLERR